MSVVVVSSQRLSPPPGAPPKAQRRDGGFTLYEIMMVVAIIALVASFAVPGMLDARRVANEAGAVATVHAIFDAQGSYARKYPILDRPSPFAESLVVLQDVDLLPAVLTRMPPGAGGVPSTVYKHSSYLLITGLLGDEHEMFIAATPEALGKTGNFSFLMRENGVVYRRQGPLFVDPTLGNPIGQ